MAKGKIQRVERGITVYEGERLTALLQAIRKEVASTKLSSADDLPVKLWYKQQFAAGVNEVTRFLERMPPAEPSGPIPTEWQSPRVKLQAVLVAGDCSPKSLTKHLVGLALSRKVPLVQVEDNRKGSFRLGELVMLKTAVAIGIKDRGNTINKVVADCLEVHE